MKVIFIKDVKKQAHKDEIKEVKDGYAKFLISEGLAVPYTSKSANVLDNEIKDRELKEQALIDECNKYYFHMFIHLHMNLFINIIAYIKIKKKL